MKKLFVFCIIMISLLLSGCTQVTQLLDKDYYVSIYEDYDTFHNNQYIYILKGYDKNGKEKLITFFIDEPLEDEAIVKVKTTYDGYTAEPELIHMEDVPEKAREKLLNR